MLKNDDKKNTVERVLLARINLAKIWVSEFNFHFFSNVQIFTSFILALQFYNSFSFRSGIWQKISQQLDKKNLPQSSGIYTLIFASTS